MMRAWILLGVLIALSSVAQATGLTGYACQGWGMTVLTGPAICGTAPAPPVGCTGTINASEGCPMPMMGM